MNKVLITGASGFLGSHIAEVLVANKFEVIALKRKQTDCWRCDNFCEDINWVDLDDKALWKQKLSAIKPDTLIHSAWIGVEAQNRNRWEQQIENINFLTELMLLAKDINIKRIINLGSQAEYGYLDTVVNEQKALVPTDAYGAIKVACLDIFKTFCEQNAINWIWLRLFSFFGEREQSTWLIPSLVKKIQSEKKMDLTYGRQRYAYMYVHDFKKIMLKLFTTDVASGVYNVSGSQDISLKELVVKIRNKLNPEFKLNFGVLPYRPNQSMLIKGNMTKLYEQIGEISLTDFDLALDKTINYIISCKGHIR